ncbi:hypothetical protein [Undibacterium sp. TC9W]|uniref:hypothetical protein n=1 Tax=Undibacterium sp. TC9W TaxID=3413053 RepID=UPI003BF1C620
MQMKMAGVDMDTGGLPCFSYVTIAGLSQSMTCMNRITRSDLYLFLKLLLTSPVTVPCVLICLVLFGLLWLLSLLQIKLINVVFIILFMVIGYPFIIVLQLSTGALCHLLRTRPQIDDTGFTFHRRFKKVTVLWTSIKFIREVWTPPGGSAFQFHFHEGQHLQISSTEDSQPVIEETNKLGIPFELDKRCQAFRDDRPAADIPAPDKPDPD